MKLTYQTGIAALIHLGVITFFNIANGVHSSVEQCTTVAGGDCIGNIITSMLYFMVITLWFVGLWVLAAIAQDRRSRKFAFLLMGAEAAVLMVALFNASNANSETPLLALITSLVDAALAAWVGLLALRLFISGGSRVTGSHRARRRRLSN